MSKLFIGMPRNGRTEENYKNSIKEATKLAAIVFGEEFFDVELSTVDWEEPEGFINGLERLSRNVKKLSECTHAIFFNPKIYNSYDMIFILSDLSDKFNCINSISFNVDRYYFTKDLIPNEKVVMPCDSIHA